MRPVFILNNRAGSAEGAGLRSRIAAICRQMGAEPRVLACDAGRTVTVLARQALDSGADVVVAGGGDGTINGVASVLAGSGVPMGVLPMGTLNHFAKDAGIPLDFEAAARSAIVGRPVNVDVGEVNGHVFLNNSSLGLYPRVVKQRENEQSRGARKWPAFFRAMVSALRHYPLLHVQLTVDGAHATRVTPFLFIGNNQYDVDGLDVGSRHRLDSGELSLVVARPVSQGKLVWSAVRTLISGVQTGSAFDCLNAREIVVDTGGRVRVAIDGEVMQMDSPLRYRIRPGGLRVMLPSAAERAA